MQANQIDAVLSVSIIGELITVRTRFENKGNAVVLVKMGEYGYGNPENTSSIMGEPGNPEFIVTAGDEPISYRGTFTKRAPVGRHLFTPMAPGDVIDVKNTRIDRSYHFLPGTHDYTLIHVHMEFDEITESIRLVQSRPVSFTYTSD